VDHRRGSVDCRPGSHPGEVRAASFSLSCNLRDWPKRPTFGSLRRRVSNPCGICVRSWLFSPCSSACRAALFLSPLLPGRSIASRRSIGIPTSRSSKTNRRPSARAGATGTTGTASAMTIERRGLRLGFQRPGRAGGAARSLSRLLPAGSPSTRGRRSRAASRVSKRPRWRMAARDEEEAGLQI